MSNLHRSAMRWTAEFCGLLAKFRPTAMRVYQNFFIQRPLAFAQHHPRLKLWSILPMDGTRLLSALSILKYSYPENCLPRMSTSWASRSILSTIQEQLWAVSSPVCRTSSINTARSAHYYLYALVICSRSSCCLFLSSRMSWSLKQIGLWHALGCHLALLRFPSLPLDNPPGWLISEMFSPLYLEVMDLASYTGSLVGLVTLTWDQVVR